MDKPLQLNKSQNKKRQRNCIQVLPNFKIQKLFNEKYQDLQFTHGVSNGSDTLQGIFPRSND